MRFGKVDTKKIQQIKTGFNPKQPLVSTSIVQPFATLPPNEIQDAFIKNMIVLVDNLPCGDINQETIKKRIEKFGWGFPEYCQCFANELEDNNDEEDPWLSSLFDISLTIRDKYQSLYNLQSYSNFGRRK